MGGEGVEPVELFAECTGHVVDGVDNLRIQLNLAAARDSHRPWLAYARLVVAVDVGAHGEFGAVFFGVEELSDAVGVFEGILAAGDRARDRHGFHVAALDAHEHFRAR